MAQFTLLVGVNTPVGGMVGQERTVLPPPAEDDLSLATSRRRTMSTVAGALGHPSPRMVAKKRIERSCNER